MSTQIIVGDCRTELARLEPNSIHCCVTSPPYFGLRDYGVTGQIGLEPTPDAYVAELVAVFREVKRVLRDDGTFWLNLGDSYNSGTQYNHGAPGSKTAYGEWDGKWPGHRPKIAGLKHKDLLGIPWRVAFALQADGWWLRSSIIWAKPNPMPESVTDRPTSAHENIFLLAKSERYFFDADAVAEVAVMPAGSKAGYAGYSARAEAMGRAASGNEKAGAVAVNDGTRNIRNVWTVATQPYSEAHFATFPPALIEPCIKAGCPPGGTVLDPFGGAGTTGLVADRLGRDAILMEISADYAAMAERRIADDAGMFAEFIDGAALPHIIEGKPNGGHLGLSEPPPATIPRLDPDQVAGD